MLVGVAIEEVEAAHGPEEEIRSAALAADGKTVRLDLPDMQPVHMLRVRCRIRAADRSRISLDMYLTIHKIADTARAR